MRDFLTEGHSGGAIWTKRRELHCFLQPREILDEIPQTAVSFEDLKQGRKAHHFETRFCK
jgi:hypothetical protein